MAVVYIETQHTKLHRSQKITHHAETKHKATPTIEDILHTMNTTQKQNCNFTIINSAVD
jgi:hypothetical protein